MVFALRFSGGLSLQEISEVMRVPFRKTQRYWVSSRSWLSGKLDDQTRGLLKRNPIPFLDTAYNLLDEDMKLVIISKKDSKSMVTLSNKEISGPLVNNKFRLTGGEKAVLSELVRGYSQKEISGRLFISRYTVNSHVQSIYKKLHVLNLPEAMAKLKEASQEMSNSPSNKYENTGFLDNDEDLVPVHHLQKFIELKKSVSARKA